MKLFYLILGFLSLALGIIGAFLPLLPTTPFLILSSFCFNKSSKRMHTWLLSLNIIGNTLKDWEDQKIIRRKYKVLAVVMTSLGIGGTIFFKIKVLWLQLLLVIIAILIITFILKQKEN